MEIKCSLNIYFKTAIKIFCTVLFIHSSNKCMMFTFYMFLLHSSGWEGWTQPSGWYCCAVAESCFFVTSLTAAHQASLFFTTFQSLLKLMSIESLMPSNRLILCHPLVLPWSFPALGFFPVSQLFASGGQSIGASASAWVFPMHIQGWFPLGLTNLISLLSKAIYKIDGVPVLLELIFQWGWGRPLTN